MSFYGDIDLEEPSDCEGGTDSSDDDGLYALLNNRSRPAQRRRHRSSSRGSSSSRSRSRSRSLSRSRLTAANTEANAITAPNANTAASANFAANSSSASVARLHLLEDALVGRDDVERLVADSQRHSADALVLGGASRKLIAASAAVGTSKAAVAAESLEAEAADFERMMEQELDRVVVKHVEEQKRRWKVGRGMESCTGGGGDPEDVDMEVDDSKTQSTTDSGSKTTSVSTPSAAQEFYDDIYFDSDDNADDDENDNGVNSNPSTLQSSSISGAADSKASNVNRVQRTIEENEQRTKKQKNKMKKKHPVLTNDELFYDPNKDDEDQKWVDDRRRKIFFPSEEKTNADQIKEKSKEEAGEGDIRTAAPAAAAAAANGDADMKDEAEKGTAGDASDGAAAAAATTKASVKAKKKKNRKAAKATRLPNSDATLSCPGCITTLTMDCQKHEIYAHQYRAMFVSNCVVDTRQVLTYPKDNNKKKIWKNKKESNLTTPPSAVSSSSSPIDFALGEDKFHPVRCAECETQVAVYDKDEIYYFFNVLASH